MTTNDDNHITFIVPKHQLPAFIGSDGSITFMGRGSQNQKLARPGTWVRENIGIGNSMTTFAKTLKAELDGLKKEYEQYWRPSKTDSTSRVLTVSKAIERHTRERIARLENIWAQDYAEGRT